MAIREVSAALLARFAAVAGSVGAAFGLSALWPLCGTNREEPSVAAGLVVLSGLTAAAPNTVYTRQVLATRADFTEAFGADWEQRIPSQLKDRMLTRSWTWVLPAASGACVERDVPLATLPGTDRTLLADRWSPPEGVTPSGLGFIYFHGGGYTAFDMGGPTETWFRHWRTRGTS